MIELFRGALPGGGKRTIWLNVNDSGVFIDAQDLMPAPEPFDEDEWGVRVLPDDMHRLLIDFLVEARGAGSAAEMSKELGSRSDAEVTALLRPILVALYHGQIDAVDTFRDRLRALGIADNHWVYY